jgi:hypothetical protein
MSEELNAKVEQTHMAYIAARKAYHDAEDKNTDAYNEYRKTSTVLKSCRVACEEAIMAYQSARDEAEKAELITLVHDKARIILKSRKAVSK